MLDISEELRFSIKFHFLKRSGDRARRRGKGGEDEEAKLDELSRLSLECIPALKQNDVPSLLSFFAKELEYDPEDAEARALQDALSRILDS